MSRLTINGFVDLVGETLDDGWVITAAHEVWNGDESWYSIEMENMVRNNQYYTITLQRKTLDDGYQKKWKVLYKGVDGFDYTDKIDTKWVKSKIRFVEYLNFVVNVLQKVTVTNPLMVGNTKIN